MRSKIPGLADIPIVGGIFRTKSEFEATTSLLILVTPRIAAGLDDAKATGKKPPKTEIGGPISLTSSELKAKVSVNKRFRKYKGKITLAYEGTVQTGEHAGRTVVGKLTLRLKGDRSF